jgi:superfamily II DNA or RNA helicase
VKKIEEFHLSDWQKRCLGQWHENGCRGIISVATGAGKTMLALAATNLLFKRGDVGGVRVKVIVPKIFLAHQWKREFIKELAIPETDVGLYYGSIKNNPKLTVMIYVLNSARYSISRHIIDDIRTGKSLFLICDEVHHFGSAENAHVFDFIPHIPCDRFFSLGLSATPEVEHLDDVIIPAVGKVIFRYDITEAVRERVAAPYDLFRIAAPFSEAEADEYEMLSGQIGRIESLLFHLNRKSEGAGRHDQVRRLNALIAEGGRIGQLAERLKNLYLRRKEVLLLANSRVECGEELLKLLLPNQRIIVFTERIRTANALFERLNSCYPNRISRYHSHMDTAQKQIALEDYRSGRCSVLLCCRALDEGLNVPDTDVGILISSSNNQRQRIQRIGRIVRKTDANRSKRIYYLYVPNTVESPDILQTDSRSAKMIDTVDLRFDPETGRILNATYDCVAEEVLRKLSGNRATEKQFENAVFQLRKGAVALDYRMSEADCIRRLKDASSSEKDYLSAMLLIIRATNP